jgi:hypothetical protein
MDPRIRELVLLGLLCAFLCSIAWMYDQPVVAAAFAALACGTVILGVAVRANLYMRAGMEDARAGAQ